MNAIYKAPDPEMVDDENPEWTEADFNKAVRVSALPPSLQSKLKRGPQKAPLKVHTTLRLDADVIAAFRATGKGWQTRVNEVLRHHLPRSA